MIADMIAVGMGDKSERLALPWIEPKGPAGKLKPAMEPDVNQTGKPKPGDSRSPAAARAKAPLNLHLNLNLNRAAGASGFPESLCSGSSAGSREPGGAPPGIDTRLPNGLNFPP